MAVVAIMFGGFFGFLSALIALVLGAGLLSAMACWMGLGLVASAILLGSAHLPQRESLKAQA